jgi:hypothetical protein
MLYIVRNAEGKVTGLTSRAGKNTEPLDIHKKDIRAYLEENSLSLQLPTQDFVTSDLMLVRVLEDLISTLIGKGLINITDLPSKAVEKLNLRSSLRKRKNDLSGLMGAEDDSPLL